MIYYTVYFFHFDKNTEHFSFCIQCNENSEMKLKKNEEDFQLLPWAFEISVRVGSMIIISFRKYEEWKQSWTQITAFKHLSQDLFHPLYLLIEIMICILGICLSSRRRIEPTSTSLEISNAQGKKLKIFFSIFIQLHFGILISLGYKYWSFRNSYHIRKCERNYKNRRNDS